jgi:hypothetical protein
MHRIVATTLIVMSLLVSVALSAPPSASVTAQIPPTLPPACTYVPRVPCLTPDPVTPGPDIPPTLEPARPARWYTHLPLIRAPQHAP